MRFLVAAALLAVLPLPPGAAQHQPDPAQAGYRIYTATGEQATLDDVIAAMEAVEVVFIGEQHDDSLAHVLQQRLLEALHARYEGGARPLVLSLEMFERDVQPVLDEYLEGLITERHFLGSSRPWTNYEDYRPLIEFARAHGLPVVAANAPHRYVNRVARLGPASLAGLPEQARAWLAPLPYPEASPAYRADWDRAMQAMQADHEAEAAPADTAAHKVALAHASPHSGASHLLEAQMLRDATMAYAIAAHLMRQPEALVLHLTGAFHVEGGTGTPELLARYRPGTRTLTVMIQPGDRPAALDAAPPGSPGDFVVFTDMEE